MSARVSIDADLAWCLAGSVTDPELPMLTLEDLGVLRAVDQVGDRFAVTITPTYSGCPAMSAMRADLVRRFAEEGLEAEVRVSLAPPWSTDWITPRGRELLRANGISPPGAASGRVVGLALLPTRREVSCPRCGSDATELDSEFGPTACTALYRCSTCLEPFEHVKEI